MHPSIRCVCGLGNIADFLNGSAHGAFIMGRSSTLTKASAIFGASYFVKTFWHRDREMGLSRQLGVAGATS